MGALQRRIARAALWTPSENGIVLINKGVPSDEIKASTQRSIILMAEDAMEKIQAGKTTLEELKRALRYSSIEQFRRFTNSLTLYQRNYADRRTIQAKFVGWQWKSFLVLLC
jgi:hypothetical protein